MRYFIVFGLLLFFCNDLQSQETALTFPTLQRYKIDTDRLFIIQLKKDLKALRTGTTQKVALKDGIWKQFYKDDSTKVTRIFTIKNLFLSGTYKSYYKNGQLYELSELLDGRHNGKYFSYYSNGKLKERGKYVTKKESSESKTKIGTWKYWDRAGNLTFEHAYSNNAKNETIKGYYANGNLRYVTKYVSGKKDSISVDFAKDGTVILSQTYKNDILQNATNSSYQTGSIPHVVSNEKQPENTTKEATIKVFTMTCKYDYQIVPDISQHISLWKNGKEIYTFDSTNDWTIKAVPYGEYEISYTTYFNTCERLSIKVDSAHEMIRVCLDRIDYSTNDTILLLDEMRVGETVRFDCNSRGCFDMYLFELSVSKMIDHYTVTYKNKTHQLSIPQYELLREFEMELRSDHSSRCSTIDTYLITNTSTLEPYKNVDGSCAWRGFHKLITMLNLKQ